MTREDFLNFSRDRENSAIGITINGENLKSFTVFLFLFQHHDESPT